MGGDGGGGGGGVAAAAGAAAGAAAAEAVARARGTRRFPTLEDFDFFLRFCLDPAVGLSLPVRGATTGDLPETNAARFLDTEDLGGTFVHCLDPRFKNARFTGFLVFVPPLGLDSGAFTGTFGVGAVAGRGPVKDGPPLCCSFSRAR